MTLVGFLGAFASLGVHGPVSGRLADGLAAVAVFAYLCLDNLDGAHARRTGRSSAMGELLDHGLDGWSMAFVSLSVARACALGESMTLLLVAGGVLAYAYTFLEQRATGRIVWGAFGTNEALIVAVGVLAAGATLGPWWIDVARGVPYVGLAVLLLGHLITVLASLARIVGRSGEKGVALGPIELLMPIGVVAAVGLWWKAGTLPYPAAIGLMLVLATATGGSAVMANLGIARGWAQSATIGAVLLGSAVGMALDVPVGLAYAVVAIGTVCTTIDVVRSVSTMRDQ
jgi:phosphatidylglycerophosphate synthase